MSQPKPGTHVRPGFENAPEVADCLLESCWPDGPLAGRDAFLVEFQGVLAAGGMFGQQDIGIGAVGAD